MTPDKISREHTLDTEVRYIKEIEAMLKDLDPRIAYRITTRAHEMAVERWVKSIKPISNLSQSHLPSNE